MLRTEKNIWSYRNFFEWRDEIVGRCVGGSVDKWSVIGGTVVGGFNKALYGLEGINLVDILFIFFLRTEISSKNEKKEKQKHSPEVFVKKVVLKNFQKFSGKHLCQSLFFNKVVGWRRRLSCSKRYD